MSTRDGVKVLLQYMDRPPSFSFCLRPCLSTAAVTARFTWGITSHQFRHSELRTPPLSHSGHIILEKPGCCVSTDTCSRRLNITRPNAHNNVSLSRSAGTTCTRADTGFAVKSPVHFWFLQKQKTNPDFWQNRKSHQRRRRKKIL